MSGKNRAFALAVATAATIGLGAPAASAATFGGGGNGNSSLINVSNNQVPVQACNDYVAVNVLGVQVPLQSIAAALSVLSPGDTFAAQNSSCAQATIQDNGREDRAWGSDDPDTKLMRAVADDPDSESWGHHHGDGDHGNGNRSLVNVSNNQVPVQLCNDTVAVNVLGVQVPASGLSGALGVLSSGDTKSRQNSSCGQLTGQRN
ncbi:MAG TPA: hypothetical protein VFB06_20270 [Streptosporangiaceae bacterium]|nr:hypothetical protein [Streptosporangiaceae bacterium]